MGDDVCVWCVCGGGGGRHMGCQYTQCTKSGGFMAKQCTNPNYHGAFRNNMRITSDKPNYDHPPFLFRHSHPTDCWCVDETGTEIMGSRKNEAMTKETVVCASHSSNCCKARHVWDAGKRLFQAQLLFIW